MLHNNWIALVLTFTAALAWLRLLNFLAQRGWITSHLSRKLIHIGTGPIYVLCWLLFEETPSARYLAAIVPLTITAQFLMVGLGLLNDPASVQAMSRTGKREELLQGPLYYGIVFVVLTLIYWRENPIGITALMIVCGGDGLADILGRTWGAIKLPWNPGKSWIGSAGMFFGGWLTALIVLTLYTLAGYFPESALRWLAPTAWVALAATAVETLPIKDIDNITITLAALAVGPLVF